MVKNLETIERGEHKEYGDYTIGVSRQNNQIILKYKDEYIGAIERSFDIICDDGNRADSDCIDRIIKEKECRNEFCVVVRRPSGERGLEAEILEEAGFVVSRPKTASHNTNS